MRAIQRRAVPRRSAADGEARPRGSSLGRRLVALVLVAALPAFGLIVYGASEARSSAAGRAKADALRVARLAAATEEGLVEGASQLLLALARHPQVTPGATGCNGLMDGIRRRNARYANLGVADARGRVFCSGLPLDRPVTIADRLYFRRAVASRGFGAGEYQIGRVTNRASINFGHAVVRGGRVRAVVIAALDLGWLNRLATEARLPAGSTLTVVDRNGTVLVRHPDPQRWIGKQLPEAPVVRAMLARSEGTVRAEGFDGTDRLFGFTRLHGAPGADELLVAVGTPSASAFGPADRAMTRSLALLAAAVLLAAAAAWGVGGVLVGGPVRSLASAATRLRAGDLAARVPEGGRGELAALGREFNRMAESLHGITRRHRLVLDSAGDGIYGFGADGRVEFVNPAAAEALGWPADELIGRPAHELVHPTNPDGGLVPEERCGVCGAAKNGVSYRCTNGLLWRRDGTSFPIECIATPLRDNGDVTGAVVVFRDVTALNAYTTALEFQARHDPLTGLPNRLSIHDALRSALASGPGALLLLDLDRFKEINYGLGHTTGDRLLDNIGARIKSSASTALVGRLGGDEFAVVLPGAGVPAARSAARTILADMRRPFTVEGLSVDVRASIGIAMFPEDGGDVDTLIRRADVALYAAKRAGSGFARYLDGTDPYSPERIRLIGELRQAIDGDRLFLLYQPKIDLRTQQAVSLEALVRWRHPRLGVVAPEHFIALAEQTGSIRPLTKWVLNEALRQAQAWRRDGWSVPIAVNLSARDLADPEFADRVVELLDAWGVAPDALGIEITEGVIVSDPARAREVLGRLAALGVRISIDDFGVGYSSLGYLRELPVDELKIEKSFVVDMTVDGDDEAIVRSTIDLGHDLGLTVVAEGVEDRETWERLASLGCDAAQGFYFSPPLSSADVRRRYAPDRGSA